MTEYVDVELELDNDVIVQLALEAHRRDVTLNQLLNDILREMVEKEDEDDDPPGT